MSCNVPRVREVPRHNGCPFVFIHPFKRYDKPSFTRGAAIWAKRPTGSGAAYPLLVDVLGASNKPAGATDGDGILSSSFRLIPSLYLFLFLYFSFCLFNVFFLFSLLRLCLLCPLILRFTTESILQVYASMILHFIRFAVLIFYVFSASLSFYLFCGFYF